MDAVMTASRERVYLDRDWQGLVANTVNDMKAIAERVEVLAFGWRSSGHW